MFDRANAIKKIESIAANIGKSQSRVLNSNNDVAVAREQQIQDLIDRINFCDGIINRGNFEFMPVEEKLLDAIFNSGVAKYELSRVDALSSKYHLKEAEKSFEWVLKFKPEDEAARHNLNFLRSGSVKTAPRDLSFRGDFEALFAEYQRKNQVPSPR